MNNHNNGELSTRSVIDMVVDRFNFDDNQITLPQFTFIPKTG